MSITTIVFRAEPRPAPTDPPSAADRSAEAMRRLRDPFATEAKEQRRRHG